MSIIDETIQRQKLKLTKKQRQQLADAIREATFTLIDKSMTYGFHMGKDKGIEGALFYAKRTLETNI